MGFNRTLWWFYGSSKVFWGDENGMLKGSNVFFCLMGFNALLMGFLRVFNGMFRDFDGMLMNGFNGNLMRI